VTLDPYRALGLRRDATDAEVKAAHRRLAKRHHPDAGGDHDRFLRVQEAYRILSDPLLRREWDDRHAPGPVRAARDAAPPRPRPRPRPGATQQERAAPGPPPADEPGTDERAADAEEPASRRPRSTRAYTWSASEVPWWEDGATSNRRQPGRRRPARPAEPAQPTEFDAEPGPRPDAAPNPFDVYNRSSGAAWSMAARAYFRRGDQELPRRGTFHYEGTQVLTGARARAAAAAAAAAAASPAPSTPWTPPHAPPPPGARVRPTANAGVSRDAQQIFRAREAFRRRLAAPAWPSLRQRLVYALLAWIPIAIAVGYGGSVYAGCDVASIGCPPDLATFQTIALALSLGLLVALPRLAYVGAIAALGAFAVGLVAVGAIALLGVQQPLSPQALQVIVGGLAAGYLGAAAVVLLRNPRTRPWAVAPGGAR
jgi:curved DNA-binding protein CbpA